jgi:hypothetical protein
MNSLKRLALGRDFWKYVLESDESLAPKTTNAANPNDLARLQRVGPLYMSWAATVEVYSVGSLSKHGDKFIALSGIATEMQHVLSDDQYIAGLWRFSLPSYLLWLSEKSNDTLPYRPIVHRLGLGRSIEGQISFS